MECLWMPMIFSVAALLITRCFMAAAIRTSQSKKERKTYKADVAAWDRWFFWSASKFVKDKFSKFEHRVIANRSIAKLYRALNLILHTVFLIELAVIICGFTHIVDTVVIDVVCIFYLLLCLLILVILAITEFGKNRRYHRSRYKQ